MSKAAELAALIGSQTAQGNKNFVINGAMNVAQRSASVTGLGDGDEGYVTLDRIRHTAAASAGRFTSAQTAISDLPGFLNCLHLDCTTADTSIASSELLVLEHRMEGQNLQQLKKGTSSAERITVSFYMKTNKAFTFMCALNDYDNNRINTQQFTTTTDWTRHSITFVGDTTGALGDDSGNSLSVEFYLHAGATYTGGTYSANTWQSRQASDNMRAVGIGSFYDSTDNDIKLTGLQVEIGDVATAFEVEDFATTLAKCQRYYQKSYNYSVAPATNTQVGATYQTTDASGNYASAGYTHFPVRMRATPTITSYDFAGNSGKIRGGADNVAVVIQAPSENGFGNYVNNVSSGAGAGIAIHYEASAEL